MINPAAWTARFTYFAAFAGSVAVLLIGWAIDSSFSERFFGVGSGYVWALIFLNVLIFAGFAGIQLMKNAAPKFFSDLVSSTLSPTARLKPIPQLEVGDGEHRRVSHPEMDVFALGGGGPVAGLSIHGDGNFFLARKGLAIEVQKNIMINGYTHAYYPIDFVKMAMASGLYTGPLDDRTKLAGEWLEYLRPLKGFDDGSIIYVAEVPIFPMQVISPKGAFEIDLPDPKLGRITLKSLATPLRILFDFTGKNFAKELTGELKARADRAQQQLSVAKEEAKSYVEAMIRMRDAYSAPEYYQPDSFNDRMRGPITPPEQGV